ncbi:uncharacterized protein LOC135351613 [Halichondria panicea]|uniref:uncharacterized protein LOC135351613 n=1 Tax=Halichondria panicea TaxID=6063 RepID=UPI00312B78C6
MKNRSQETPGLALIPKLKYEHVELSSFSKMRVDLAAQVLSNSVAKALQLTQGDEVAETITFVDKFNKLFNTLNVSSISAGKLKRNPFKDPYRSASDFRLKWLEEEFIPYLDAWEKSVEAREGFTKTQKKLMMLSPETSKGLRITGEVICGNG